MGFESSAMKLKEVIAELKSMGNPKAVEGMTRYGINADRALGVSIPKLEGLAKKLGKSHKLAEDLWSSAIHEARILACMVDDPQQITADQLESWVSEFDSWDLCDQCCNRLFRKTPFARQKALAWANRLEEFVKRAGFVLMAALSVHDKKASDEDFVRLLPIIKKHATDERNFVKKAVNWALRQIGKRNTNLNRMAIKTAGEIKQLDSKSARWIASDAIRELTGEKVQKKLASVK